MKQQREIKFRAWDEEEREMFEVSGMRRKDGMVTGDDTWYGDDFLAPALRISSTLMQYTGLKDKNGKEIYEGDIIGKEGVYHFLDRKGWEPSTGDWKIIGEKTENFTGHGEERYIAGYKLEIVRWEDTSCGFEPFSDSEDNCGCCGGGVNARGFEIIGNIYQNPELLNTNEK